MFAVFLTVVPTGCKYTWVLTVPAEGDREADEIHFNTEYSLDAQTWIEKINKCIETLP